MSLESMLTPRKQTINRQNIVTKHQLILQFKRVVCRNYNNAVVESINCSLTKHDITKQLVLNFEFRLRKPITDLVVNYKLLLNRSGIITKFHQMEADFCNFFDNRFDFFVVRMIAQEIRRSSNIPFECPLKKNYSYHARNFSINSKLFPQFLPNLNWSSYANFSVHNDTVVGFYLFGSLVRKHL
ncbi:PREDICTED: uncharacterized protein LOC108965605 [Bactrocera latifrons]|uniref:uncharacterized protein LOC108965605 n=1 Tax=Bactrocera latifrons TaxID=174628 RepID=UPI0008DE7813|nr:PREDICTED: uncharacterized protein LOC108965605 [Bactrocera latifrons]